MDKQMESEHVRPPEELGYAPLADIEGDTGTIASPGVPGEAAVVAGVARKAASDSAHKVAAEIEEHSASTFALTPAQKDQIARVMQGCPVPPVPVWAENLPQSVWVAAVQQTTSHSEDLGALAARLSKYELGHTENDSRSTADTEPAPGPASVEKGWAVFDS